MYLSSGRFEQGVSTQGVTTFVWRPGWQYDVAATRGADRRRRQCTGKRLLRTIFRVPKAVPLVNRAFAPPRRGDFGRKRWKWRLCVLTSKTWVLLLNPVKRREWRKWRVSRGQRHGLPKAPFFCSLKFGRALTSWAARKGTNLRWGTSKQHMKLQQPRNYDFRASQFDPPRSQSGNDRETTTSPPGHHWEANVALTTTAKLQQLRVNSREMTTFAESCSDRENATTVKWQVRNCTIAAKFASDFASLCGCCCFKCLLEVSDKGTNANLRFSAGSCGFLRFPAKICGFLRKSAFPKPKGPGRIKNTTTY